MTEPVLTKEQEVYNQYPEVFAFLKAENGKMSFHFNETQVAVQDVMIILQSTVTEYLKEISVKVQESNQSQTTEIKE